MASSQPTRIKMARLRVIIERTATLWEISFHQPLRIPAWRARHDRDPVAQRPRRAVSDSPPASPRPMIMRTAAGLLAVLMAVSPAAADAPTDCAAAPPVLWGDGQHDDTAALNAWFRGETVVGAQTHVTAGSRTADRSFLLSATVYVHGGARRQKEGCWIRSA